MSMFLGSLNLLTGVYCFLASFGNSEGSFGELSRRAAGGGWEYLDDLKFMLLENN